MHYILKSWKNIVFLIFFLKSWLKCFMLWISTHLWFLLPSYYFYSYCLLCPILKNVQMRLKVTLILITGVTRRCKCVCSAASLWVWAGVSQLSEVLPSCQSPESPSLQSPAPPCRRTDTPPHCEAPRCRDAPSPRTTDHGNHRHTSLKTRHSLVLTSNMRMSKAQTMTHQNNKLCPLLLTTESRQQSHLSL